MYFPVSRHCLLVLALLMLSACHSPQETPAAPGGPTPEAAVRQSVVLIKAGDLTGFWKHALPPADYATLREDLTGARAAPHPMSDEDRLRFEQAVQQLTAPGAQTMLYNQFKPKLAEFERRYRDQLPVMIGIGQAILATGVAENKTLTQNQKQHLRDVLNVLLPWAQQTAWFDQDKAKEAVTVVVTTARRLDLKSADALHPMDFDTAMQKYATAYQGLKQLLAIYGLSIDDTLNSIKVSTLSIDHDLANVKIDYALLGKPLSIEGPWLRVDGHWYNKDLIDAERAWHAQRLQPPATNGTASAAP